MSEPRLFDLSKQQITELDIRIQHERGVAHISSNAGPLFDILNNIEADEQRDVNLYKANFCYTGFHAQSQTSALVDLSTDRTIGYVFPITAFRDSESFSNNWERRFADVGFRRVINLETLAVFSTSGSVVAYRGNDFYLDEVIPDDLSILVLGTEGLEGLDADLASLELMLSKAGITLLDSPGETQFAPKAASWKRRVKLSKPGQLASSDAPVFLSLIQSADRDPVGVGAFMHLYQILEFCIDNIFDWGVNAIATESLDTWTMKARLSEITGESYRLSVLDTDCLKTLHSREPLNILRASCSEFLTKLDIIHDETNPWYKLLYKCRNVIVHNQIKMLKSSSVTLSELNTCLRAAALEVLFAFDRPGA